MREQIVNKKGLHSTMERVVQSLSENRNISDLDNLERGEWRDFLDDLPDHMYEKETAEAVYFVGCVASFFPSVQTIPEKLVQIFDAAQVDFAILGGEEWCCGFPLIGAGVPDKMQELMYGIGAFSFHPIPRKTGRGWHYPSQRNKNDGHLPRPL
jgi:heterodisulfide reductase subunit D